MKFAYKLEEGSVAYKRNLTTYWNTNQIMEENLKKIEKVDTYMEKFLSNPW